ncbi:hypothetical protein ABZ780_01245 [Micromonospora sp. NPDC047467]|uniref:hypothetical protein n=1 Tax=Micromonospora sp. NPDC047467 TaxID=3154814 RepID=UPI0034044126
MPRKGEANTKLDSRIADHYNTSTGTLYAQVGKDVQLRADRKIQQAVWYGTEAPVY